MLKNAYVSNLYKYQSISKMPACVLRSCLHSLAFWPMESEKTEGNANAE